MCGPRSARPSSIFARRSTLPRRPIGSASLLFATFEHYFHYYGGYSPNPIVFLSAASQRTTRARLVTGAVLPAFNHPLKLAGEVGMLDAISGGRLEVGFARAFLPHEFARFGVSVHESRERFEEGIAAGASPARGGECHDRGQVPQLQECDVLTATDSEAAPALLGGRLLHTRELYQCRHGRP